MLETCYKTASVPCPARTAPALEHRGAELGCMHATVCSGGLGGCSGPVAVEVISRWREGYLAWGSCYAPIVAAALCSWASSMNLCL